MERAFNLMSKIPCYLLRFMIFPTISIVCGTFSHPINFDNWNCEKVKKNSVLGQKKSFLYKDTCILELPGMSVRT